MPRFKTLRLLTAGLILTLVPASSSAGEDEAKISSEIDDQIWSVVSRTVVDHDIEGMAAIYHPDAVLVNARGTVPIAPQLAIWGEGMETMKSEGATATVAFRFDSRHDNESTAFETGIFRYATTDAAGVESPSFVLLEALLIKQDGRWLILMERQLEATDEAAWNALAAGH
jgi:uncharacterized protein (TIGR02246 family)